MALLITAACGGGNAPEVVPTVEVNRSPDANQIPYIGSGETAQGTLGGNITAQLYAFNATAENVVVINMTQAEGTTLNPYLVVLGNAGQVVGADDNSGPVPNSAQMEVTIPANGTYFVIASSAETIDGIQAETIDGEQPYTLAINGHTPPSEQGTRILYYRGDLTYDTPPPERGYSSPVEPVYFYGFQGQAGDNITAIMRSSNIDGMLSLFDPNGNRIAVNDDAATAPVSNITDPALENITLPETGTYLLMASNVLFHQLPEDYPGAFFDIIVNRN